MACRSAGAADGDRSSGELPPAPPAGSTPTQVADWAALSFRRAAAANLTKACLLLALGEEAAAAAAYAEAEGLVGSDSLPSSSSSGDASTGDASAPAAASFSDAALQRSVGGASTWSLARLEALADEAALAFYAQLDELGVADVVLRESTSALPDSTLLTLHADLARSYPMQLITAVNHVLFERHGYRRQRRHGDPLE